MMLGIQLVCFFITFYVLFYYILKGVQSKAHRLLPLLLGIISFYNVLQVFQYILDLSGIIMILENVILIQVLYVLVHYVLEFSYLKLPKWGEASLIISMIVIYCIAHLHYQNPRAYNICFSIYAFLYLLLVLILATYVYRKRYLSMRDHHVANMLYLALVVPEIALQFRKNPWISGDVLVPISIAFSCLVALYLMKTDQLEDTTFLVKENMFNTSDIAMVLFDADGYYLAANRVAKEIFENEYKGQIDEKGTSHNDIQLKDVISDMDVNAEIEMNHKIYYRHIEEVFVRGKKRGYIISFGDMTKVKQEMKQMEELKKEAEIQSVFKSKFLANMSHDLRSPLHALLGLNDILLSKKNLSAKNRSYILQMRSASMVLLGIVNDILLYSRMEAGKLILSNEIYDFSELVRELAQMSLINLKQKPIRFTLDFLTECPQMLIGDKMRVREMIQNLFSNAVKFTEEGSINCQISCELVEDGTKAKICCTVRDTGTGMSQEQLEKIFGEYVSFASQNSKEGIGLGLTIVSQLAEMMGGTVQAQSDGESGTSITIYFLQELTQENKMMKPVHYSGEELLHTGMHDTTGFVIQWVYPEASILLVDDMLVNQEIFRELVSAWKIKIDLVSSGKEAIEQVQKHFYDMIFLDQMMPEMTGLETADILQNKTETPMILLTADISDETMMRAKEHGLAGFLAKPIKLEELEEQFEQFIPRNLWVQNSANEEELRREVRLQRHNAYQKTLKSIVMEFESLESNIAQYADEDIDLFRIKVHGIKGVMKQVGILQMARTAEIMEMAAKTNNLSFIRDNMDDFMMEYQETLKELKEELYQITAEEETSIQKERVSRSVLNELWMQLKEAFDGYDFNKIEEIISKLKQIELDDVAQEVLEQLKDASDEMDYEEGSSILMQFFKK